MYTQQGYLPRLTLKHGDEDGVYWNLGVCAPLNTTLNTTVPKRNVFKTRDCIYIYSNSIQEKIPPFPSPQVSTKEFIHPKLYSIQIDRTARWSSNKTSRKCFAMSLYTLGMRLDRRSMDFAVIDHDGVPHNEEGHEEETNPSE